MDRTIVLSILGAAVLGFLGMLLLMPDSLDDGPVRLPWLIEQDAQGRTGVFGFRLGETSLAEVRRVFREEGEINLFHNPGASEPYGVEAFFERIHLQRLRADFVIALAVDQETLGGMYDRGLRISQLGSGGKKVRLDPMDEARLAEKPIRSIGYLPKARLDEALIEQRFGTPSERLTESGTDIVHWLYPERGLDIGRDPKGQVIIQYVNPADMESLLAPLRRLESEASPASRDKNADAARP